MRPQSIRNGKVAVEYTDKPLTGWGGLALMFEYLSKVGFYEALQVAIPDTKTSPNQIKNRDIVNAFVATVLRGGSRFAHVERVRDDEVLRTVCGAERLPGEDSVRRLFNAFKASDVEQMYGTLQALTLQLLTEQCSEDVLDLDSTILERYGEQEGVGKGYHPRRAAQRSHHPLLGMLASSKHIVHAWLRAGGASTRRGAVEFVDELMARIPSKLKISAVRADSGFFSAEYLSAFEARALPYIIAVRMYPPTKRYAASIAEERWERVNEKYDVADVQYKANWKEPRRVLFLRRAVEKNSKGMLFDIPLYEYSALVTTLDLSAEKCMAFYQRRGECENTIKEFKNDYSARGFCLNSFNGTDAVFRFLAVLFNLMTEFKRRVLNNTSVTLNTVRTKLFVLGAVLGRRARQHVLRLGLSSRWSERFDRLLHRVLNLVISTAPQLEPIAPNSSPA